MTARAYPPDSIRRALDAHKANGLIRDWRLTGSRENYTRVTGWMATVDLVDGYAAFPLRNLREGYVFVAGLASAKLAMNRRTADRFGNLLDAAEIAAELAEIAI